MALSPPAGSLEEPQRNPSLHPRHNSRHQPGPGPGSLTLVDIGGQGHTSVDVIRGRIEQWHAWAQRRTTHGQAEFASLSDLPTLIAGAARLPEGGSVLKAA